MSTGPRNAAAAKIRHEQAVARAGEDMKLSEWFTLPAADSVARRHEVFALLNWYHEQVVKPNRGLRGLLRRLWLRLRGRRWQLLSPWEQIHERVVLEQRRRELQAILAAQVEADLAAENGGGRVADA